MRFEDRPEEQKFKDAYLALGDLRIALRAIAYRQPNASARATLDRIAESHLGVVEQLVKSEHHAYLLTAPAPRMVFTEEDQRDPKLSEALARLPKAPKAPEESRWQEGMRKAAEEDDEFERRLTEAMIDPDPAAADLATMLYRVGQRVTEDIYEKLRHELEQEPELPADPTGVGSFERYESSEDQA